MKDDRVVRTMFFPGSLAGFAAFIERLGDQGGWSGWTFDGERLYVNPVEPDDEAEVQRRPPGHKSWEICHFPEEETDSYFDTDFGGTADSARYAGIEAYDDFPDVTTVVFWNGYTPRDSYTLWPEVKMELLDRLVEHVIVKGELRAKRQDIIETKEKSDCPAGEPGDGLDGIDHKIIELVPKLKKEGYKVTDTLLARRLPLNYDTNEPYHRVTVNRRRNKLRDKGYDV